MAERASRDLYYLSSVILGYDKVQPRTHGPLCRFFDTAPQRRRLMLMPRSHFKSSLITISGTVQDITNDPNVTILLGAATDKNAQRFLEEIKRHFMNNEVFRWLYPHLVWDSDRQAPRWNKQEMEVPRDTFVREPTVDTIGSRGEVISRHYLIIRLDDIIGEKEYNSESEMTTTCEWLSGVESLLVPPFHLRLIDLVGTRWKLDDAYAFAEFLYGGTKAALIRQLGPHAMLKGDRLAIFSREVRENGKLIFPESFDERQLRELQRADPDRFAAQYLNNPLASGTAEFQTSWLKYYRYDENGHLVLEDYSKPIRVDRMPIFILCDPSLGESRKSDRTAILVVGVYLDGHPRLIVLDSFIERVPPNEIIRKLFELHAKYPTTKLVSLETAAFQKALKYWIEEVEVQERRPPLPIAEFKPGSEKTKIERIKGMQPLCKAGQLYISEGFGEFIEEYQVWHPRAKHDDGLDALSQILSYIDFGWTKESWSQIEEFDRLMSEARDPLTGVWAANDPVSTFRRGIGV